MGLGLETWVSPHTGVGEGEEEMGSEIGRKGRLALRTGCRALWRGRPQEGLGLKGGGFWTGAEGLLGSHSQGFTQAGCPGAADAEVRGGRDTCHTLWSAVGQALCRPARQCARAGMGEPGLRGASLCLGLEVPAIPTAGPLAKMRDWVRPRRATPLQRASGNWQ